MIQLKKDGSSRMQVLLSAVLLNGLGHILYFKHYIKGVILLLLEVWMISKIGFLANSIIGLFTLGTGNVTLPILERDNSAFMMIDGITAIFILILYIMIYFYFINDALKEYAFYCEHGKIALTNKTFTEVIQDSFVFWGMLPAAVLVIGLILIPFSFAGLAAFTNLSAPAHIAPSMTFDWVGVDNFVALFGGQAAWTSAFVRVLIWTLVFAAASTAVCYLGGLLLAYILHHHNFKFRPFIQTILMLPYAIPAVISMLVWRTLLNGSFGVVNRTLMAWNLIDSPIPWLSDPLMAKFTCILVSLWAGYSYFMLLIMTTLNTISPAIYDAAAVDGASRGQTIRKLIIPLILKRTTPFIVLSFAQNLNNFTTIFFLTEGNPALANTTTTSAGGTDILATWIYNLTFNLMQFNYASVIMVILCIVLVPITIWQLQKTSMFKEEK